MYKTVNGFSNLYWGWGGEDDDLSLRFIQRRMCVVRPSYELAIYVGKKNIFIFCKNVFFILFYYVALPHPRGQRNNARFNLLTWSTVRLDIDGYEQIDSLIRYVDIRKTSTVIHLKLDVDADQSLYKPPSLQRFQSSFNETILKLTSSRKTVTTTATIITTTLSTTTTTRTISKAPIKVLDVGGTGRV